MKAKDVRELNKEEIKQKYQELKQELFNLKIQKSTGQIEKPLRVRLIRRDIAKIKTVAREKKVALL